MSLLELRSAGSHRGLFSRKSLRWDEHLRAVPGVYVYFLRSISYMFVFNTDYFSNVSTAFFRLIYNLIFTNKNEFHNSYPLCSNGLETQKRKYLPKSCIMVVDYKNIK